MLLVMEVQSSQNGFDDTWMEVNLLMFLLIEMVFCVIRKVQIYRFYHDTPLVCWNFEIFRSIKDLFVFWKEFCQTVIQVWFGVYFKSTDMFFLLTITLSVMTITLSIFMWLWNETNSKREQRLRVCNKRCGSVRHFALPALVYELKQRD